MQDRSGGYSNVTLANEYKSMLCDVLNVAYGKDKRLPAYKRFALLCSDSHRQTRLGEYRHDDRTIVLFSTESTPAVSMRVTALHELSHHVEIIQHGHTGHQAPFYAIHKRLLFAAFDMGILKPTDVTNSIQHTARNNNKLAKMMSEYVPRPISYKSETYSIRVYDAFEHKDDLKDRGYKYYASDKAWGKTFSESDNEIEALIGLGISMASIRVIDGAIPTNKLKVKITVSGTRYEQRSEMNGNGYRWDKESGSWTRMVFADALSGELDKIVPLIEANHGITVSVDQFRLKYNDGYGGIAFYNMKTRSWEKTTPAGFVKKVFGSR